VPSRLGPFLLLALLGLGFFAEVVRHPTEVLYSDYSDFFALHLASRQFLVRSWQATGELPLWCPYSFGGMPFLHDTQVSAFYPPHGLLLLVPEESQGAALSWLVVAHVILAGWSMYLYARSQALSVPAALVAAVGFMFAAKWLGHLLIGGHYNMVPLAWLPLVLLALDTAHRRPGFVSLLWASWAGAGFALFILGAFPYVTLYAGLFIALWSLGPALEQAGYLGGTAERSPQRTARALGRWLGLGAWTLLVGVGLGAVQLLPSLEAARQASRSLGVPVSSETLLGGVWTVAGLVGPPLVRNPHWLVEDRVGLGLIWLFLAVLARRRQCGRVRFQGLVCLLLLAFALGGAALFQRLPGFHFFQLPSRILLLLPLPLALLAGQAVEGLLAGGEVPATERADRRRALVKITLVVGLFATSLAVLFHCQGEVVDLQHPYWWSLLLSVPLAWWLLGLAPGRGLATAWLALLVFDLAVLSMPWVQTRPVTEIFAASACVRYVSHQRELPGRVLDFPPEKFSANCTPLWPGVPLVYEIEGVRGFNPIDVARYKEYLQLLTDRDEPLRPLDRMFTSAVLGSFPIVNQDLADLLGIRYLVQPSELPLEATVRDPAARGRWRKVYEDLQPFSFNFIPASPSGDDGGMQQLPPYSVYENSHVLPRAFVVGRAAALPERSRRLTALKQTRFQEVVLLEDWEPAGESFPGPTAYRSARIDEYLPNRVVIQVEGEAPGYLILTDVWFPGWRCTIDGKATPIYRANVLFRAVAVPAGSHEVVFRMEPVSYTWGKIVSGTTALLLVGSTAAGWLLRRRAGRAGKVSPLSQTISGDSRPPLAIL
jgi:hypothetical protein